MQPAFRALALVIILRQIMDLQAGNESVCLVLNRTTSPEASVSRLTGLRSG
jgi:hypothetical protein